MYLVLYCMIYLEPGMAFCTKYVVPDVVLHFYTCIVTFLQCDNGILIACKYYASTIGLIHLGPPVHTGQQVSSIG